MLNHYQAVYVVMNVNIIYHNKINIVQKIVQAINNMKFKQTENIVFPIVAQLILIILKLQIVLLHVLENMLIQQQVVYVIKNVNIILKLSNRININIVLNHVQNNNSMK
jgi:hypothetical protein